MRKGFFIVLVTYIFLSSLFASCTKKNSAIENFVVDSIADTTSTDTISKLISEEQQMPKSADELFDDFIFNFAGSKSLQMRRIAFPLKVINGKKESYIEKKHWKMERFFMHQGYYTLIFDNQRQMKIVKDTAIDNVVVEKINLKYKKVKKYMFKRIDGKWMLTSIINNAMYQNTNASFLTFYERFVNDSTFQLESLNNPIQFSGPDPDDDFGTMTGEIDPDTWPAFAPQLPSEHIYNIMYGQRYSEGNQKIFIMRGISNGMEMELTFKRLSGQWKLIKLSE